MSGACCHDREGTCSPPPNRHRWEFATGALSLGVWLAMPKCPMCVAAHVALWTGLGLSFTAATYLRWSLLALSGAALAYLTAKRALRARRQRPASTATV